jgi:hypothetical protein
MKNLSEEILFDQDHTGFPQSRRKEGRKEGRKERRKEGMGEEK